MRTGSGKYSRHKIALALALVAALAGCGGHAKEDRVSGSTLTVYASLPLRGSSAREAEAVASGARLALADAHGVAAGRRVRLVELDSSDPNGGSTWDPSAVQANAKRAAGDPTTIAYLGELDEGGSAISVPVTNDEHILQVAPLDGLTSLTRTDPSGPANTGPERYYPSGTRTFLRLVPTDLLQAEGLVAWAREGGARSLALVQDEHLFGREIAAQAELAARRDGLTVTAEEEARDDPTTYADLARTLAQRHPDAVIYTGVGDATAGGLLAAVKRALPNARLLGTSSVATAAPTPPGLPPVDVLNPALPARLAPPAGRRVLARLEHQGGAPVEVEALYGYEAMRIVLDAIRAAGRDGDDRAAVAREALRPRGRRSVLGTYSIVAGGDVAPARFGGYRRSGDALSFESVRTPPVQAPNR